MSEHDFPGAGVTINLSLISHTNAGKTTLTRTLLGRDVGEVRDEAHVTDLATGYVLVQAGDDTLMLWDTPGFGDTARLLSRLKMAGNPIGWLVSQVWDRWRERPLWSSQQAVKNARDEADVILYLVNAAEDPAAAGYVEQEMAVLAWIGKPIVVLLNQMGPPQENAAADIARWNAIGAPGQVRATLPLDAFARCWVQEGALLEMLAPLLPPEKQPAMAVLTARWRSLNLTRFDASIDVLAADLARAASDREPVDEARWQAKLAGMVSGRRQADAAADKAMAALASRLAEATTQSTDKLIALHGLAGQATKRVLERVGDDYAHAGKTPEGAAAIFGGLVSGAAGGLAADVAAGGLTLGGGMIVGAVLGALGAAGVAKGVNLARGDDGSMVRWSEAFFEKLTVAALLRYLAVAHFGRGRGAWSESEYPPFWRPVVEQAVADRRTELLQLQKDLAKRAPGTDSGPESAAARNLEKALAIQLRRTTASTLARLYPDAQAVNDIAGESPPTSTQGGGGAIPVSRA